MTEQEKQEIIAEIRKSVMEEMKQNAERKDAGVAKQFDRDETTNVWNCIRKLTCLICGVKYVNGLRGNPDAERICDEICQKIYDLRMSAGEKNGH